MPSISEPPTGLPEPYFTDSSVTLHHGDCLDVLRALPDSSVDAVVTDPPYGLGNTTPAQVADSVIRWVNGERDYLPGGAGFMGKAWDAFVPPVAVWDECLRVLKPGGHVLAFAGSRTHDLMTLGLRLAGFDIRDGFAWLYGSGFPKSLDVSKAIDRAAGAEREVLSTIPDRWAGKGSVLQRSAQAEADSVNVTAPATDGAKQWQGWGTALKPAYEPIVMARKPLAGTVAANVLTHGTGALNIDGCRVGDGADSQGARPAHEASAGERYTDRGAVNLAATPGPRGGSPSGRWPANVILDESQATLLDEQSGESASNVRAPTGRDTRGTPNTASEMVPRFHDTTARGVADQGGASRFFYVAKADQSERVRVDGVAHPTVKPISVMRWLVRLVTPEGGTVLEPFAGSGTTAEACILEGFKCIAIEREADYLPLIKQRIHRRRDPVAAVRGTGDDGGLFDLLGGDVA